MASGDVASAGQSTGRDGAVATKVSSVQCFPADSYVLGASGKSTMCILFLEGRSRELSQNWMVSITGEVSQEMSKSAEIFSLHKLGLLHLNNTNGV